MGKALNQLHAGLHVGRLTLISGIGTIDGVSYWECECECGQRVVKRSDVLGKAIRRGSSARCGKGCTGRRHDTHTDDPSIDWGKVIDEQHQWITRMRNTPPPEAQSKTAPYCE